MPTRYPPAERLDLAETVGGHLVRDPYRWLEDAADPRTAVWVDAQDQLSQDWFATLPGRQRLESRLRSCLRPGSVTVPVWAAGRAFVLRHHPDREHAVLSVGDAADQALPSAGRVLLDVEALDPSGRTTLDAWSPSKEGRLLAYQVSRAGTEWARLYVLDVTTGMVVDGPLERCRYSPVAWLPGGEEFYFVRSDPDGQGRPGTRRVYRHRVGTPQAADQQLRCADLDAAVVTALDVSADGRWLVVQARAAGGDSVWVLDLRQPAGAAPDGNRLRQVAGAAAGARCRARMQPDGRVQLLTSAGAARWRLCTADPRHPREWTDLLPEDPRAVLRDAVPLGRGPHGRPAVMALWSRHATSRLTVHDAASGEQLDDVELPSMGSVTALSVADPRTAGLDDTVWVGWTDFTTPPCVYAYRSGRGRLDLVEAAPGAPAHAPVHARQVAYESSDGTVVRMFLLTPSERPSEPLPALLTAYGGFGMSTGPVCSAAALAWVGAGGVWALASVRGGGEEGEEWHRAGRREHKQRAIDDLHAAADYLVREGWTDHERLGLLGSSNGGLLVGAALTQHPESYRAAVCSAPLLDMARFERMMLGPAWVGEYGSAGDPEQLGWLLAYSPYHNVRPGTRYPATLLSIFDADTRVDPAHSRKMCAALQHAAGAGDRHDGTRPILFRRHPDVGHGKTAASRVITQAIDEFAFLAWATGLTP